MANPYASSTNKYGKNANNPYYVVEDTTTQRNLGSLAQLALQAYGLKKRIGSTGSSSTEPNILTKGLNKIKELTKDVGTSEPTVTQADVAEKILPTDGSQSAEWQSVLEDLVGETEYAGKAEELTEGLDAFELAEQNAGNVAEAADITEGLDAFDLAVENQVVDQAVEDAAASVAEELAAMKTGEDLTVGLDMFDLAAESEYMGSLGAGSGLAEAEASAAGLEGAGSGAGAGGATLGSALGTVGSAVSTAVPYVAAARVGMPILGGLLKDVHGGEEESSNVMWNMADLTEKDYMRPIERLSEMAFFNGKEAPEWTGVFNPGGWLLKNACIIVSACTGRNSYEVNVARKYRDRYMSEEELTGYYTLCIFVVPFIHRYPLVKRLVKRILVDRLVDYGEWRLDMKPKMKYLTSGAVKRAFLGLCRHVGRGVDTVLAGQEV